MSDIIEAKGYASGRVQGVSFRYFVKQHAVKNQVNGYAKNLEDGRVEFLLQGTDSAIQNVLEKLQHGPELAVVESIDVEKNDVEVPHSGFIIM